MSKPATEIVRLAEDAEHALRALARRSSTAAQKTMQEHIRNAALRTGIAFVTPCSAAFGR